MQQRPGAEEPSGIAPAVVRTAFAPAVLVSLGLQLMRALAEVHRGGRAHGELDLSAVTFGSGQSESSMPRLALEIPRGRVPSGSWLAPERRGQYGQGVTQLADLWAAGRILMELAAPSSLSSPDSVPRALEEICARLMRTEPIDRYQSAEAAAEDLQDLRDALANGARDPLVPLGRRDRRQTLTEPSLVGRGSELEKLESALARAGEGQGGVVTLEGPSGGGKSYLLDELRRRAARKGALVLHGQGVQLGPTRPYQIFAEVVDQLSFRCERDDAFRTALVARLRDSLPALASMFPELARALGASAPEAIRGGRPTAALVSMVAALGEKGRPTLIVLDDAQWCDEDSRTAIRMLAEPTHHGLCALVVLGMRIEQPSDESPLPMRLRLRLPPLQGLELPSLLESMAGPLPVRALEAIELVARGNPLFATEGLRALIDCGALVPETDGWRFDPAAHERARLSGQASVLLLQRLGTLPQRVLRLLSAGAVLGKSFSASFAAQLVHESYEETAPLFSEARRRGLLAADGPDRWSFAHDRFREALLAQLSKEERRALHGRAAAALEARPGTSDFDLAHHFSEGGDLKRALPHALLAIEQSRSFDLTERACRIAQAGLELQDSEGQRRVALALSAVLTMRGRLTEAAAELSRARTLTADNDALARLDQQEGELAFRCNDYAATARSLEAALLRLGEKVPHGLPNQLFSFAREAAKYCFFWLFPKLRPRDSSERNRTTVRILHRLAQVHHLRSGIFNLIWSLFRELNLAEKIGPSPELIFALSNFAAALAQVPWPRRARQVVNRAQALALQVDEPHSTANALGFDSLVSGWSGRFDEAIERGNLALRQLEQLDDQLGCLVVCIGVGTWLFRRGYIREAVAQFELMRRLAPEVSLRYANPLANETFCRALLGHPPLAPAEPPPSRERELWSSEAKMKAAGMRLLVLGRPAEAAPLFGEVVEFSRRHNLHSEAICSIQCWHASALRLAAEREDPLAAERREQAMRQAWRVAKQAIQLARRFQIDLPHALREGGLCRAQLGDKQRAREMLDESIAVAAKQGARLEEGGSRLARARLGLAEREPGAAKALTAAHESLRALGVVQPDPGASGQSSPLRSRQLERTLESCREISAASDLPSLIAAVESAARSVLPGLRVRFATLPGTNLEGLAAAIPESESERILLSSAVRGGPPALAFDSPGSESQSGGSVLCAPVLMSGRAVACILASGRASEFLGEQVLPLAGLLASVAGAALEASVLRERLRGSERELRAQSDGVTRAREQERRRLALALHDGAGQALSAAGIHVTELMARAGETDLGDRLEDVRALLFATLDDLRSLAHELHASAAEQHGLLRALDELVSTSSSAELRVSLRANGNREKLPQGETAGAIFRIAQAALGNVIAHARARRAVVELQMPPEGLRLTVEDDGIGFSPGNPRALNGLGLTSMRERAQLLGGTITVRSRPGEGTSISLEVSNEALRISQINASAHESSEPG